MKRDFLKYALSLVGGIFVAGIAFSLIIGRFDSLLTALSGVGLILIYFVDYWSCTKKGVRVLNNLVSFLQRYKISLLSVKRGQLFLPEIPLPSSSSSRTDSDYSRYAHNLEEAYALIYTFLKEALRNNPSMERNRKKSIQQEAEKIPDSIYDVICKLVRLRKLEDSFDYGDKRRREVGSFIGNLEGKIDAGLDILKELPLAVTRVEMSMGNRGFERLVAELAETNKELQDLDYAWKELRG